MFGGLHSLVCEICNGDEGNSAFEAAKTCKQTLETHTKEKEHSCSICVRIGLVWECLKTDTHPPTTHTQTHTHTLTLPSSPPPSLLVEIKNHGDEGSPAGLLRRTPVCLCSRVYFLCVVHTVFVCQIEAAFPSRPAKPLTNCKTIPG